MTHTSKKIRKRTSYYAESVPLDLEELEEWEAELQRASTAKLFVIQTNSIAEPHDEEEQPPSDDLDAEAINSYAEQYHGDASKHLQDDELWAEFDDEWEELSLPSSP